MEQAISQLYSDFDFMANLMAWEMNFILMRHLLNEPHNTVLFSFPQSPQYKSSHQRCENILALCAASLAADT